MAIPTLEEMIADAEEAAAHAIERMYRLKEFKEMCDRDPIVSAIREIVKPKVCPTDETCKPQLVRWDYGMEIPGVGLPETGMGCVTHERPWQPFVADALKEESDARPS